MIQLGVLLSFAMLYPTSKWQGILRISGSKLCKCNNLAINWKVLVRLGRELLNLFKMLQSTHRQQFNRFINLGKGRCGV